MLQEEKYAVYCFRGATENGTISGRAQWHCCWGRSDAVLFGDGTEGSEVPEHSHPHEQAGLVLSGELQFKIGSEERILKPGEAFIVPPNVVHSGVVAKGPARVLDIFTPPREDYIDKYNKHTSTSTQTKWE